LFFAEISTQRLPRFSRQTQYKALSGKEKPNGTSSAPFCEGKHNSKNNERSKDTNKKDKHVDISGQLKRINTIILYI
jgi:hypothetical protein